MATVKVSNKRQRDIQRSMHLIGAALLLIYIYVPAGAVPFFTTLIQVVVVPVLAVTGMLMWQLPRLRTLRQRKRARAPR
jgi:hypothetical protein